MQSEHALLNKWSCGISTEDLEDFSESGSEKNIDDSGEELVPVDLEADSSDSDNDIFIFIIRINATSKIKLFFFLLCLVSFCFAVVTEKGIWYDYGLFIYKYTS